MGPPEASRSPLVADAMLAEAVRHGWITPPVLARALEPFPRPVRTLEALHLASMDFARNHGQSITLASYDDRMINAARALRYSLYAL